MHSFKKRMVCVVIFIGHNLRSLKSNKKLKSRNMKNLKVAGHSAYRKLEVLWPMIGVA